MDSDDEFLQFSDSEKQPSPVPERKLKRLRKATEKIPKDLIPSPSSDDSPSVHEVNSSIFESLHRGERNVKDFEELSARSGSQLVGFKEGTELYSGSQLEGFKEGTILDFESRLEVSKEGTELDSGLDDLDIEKVRSGVKRALEFDSLSEEFDGKGEDQTGSEVEKEIGDWRMEERPAKKRRNLEGFGEKGDKKKKKKKEKEKRAKNADDDYDEKLYSADSNKRMGKKERRGQLKELRAESQRLLRETRDATFKPVPFVQKSVSSVLEKIRQRKQELSKKSVMAVRNSFTDDNDTISKEFTLDFDFEDFPVQDGEVHKAAEADSEETTACPVDVEGSLDSQLAQGSKETVTASDKKPVDDDLRRAFRAPTDDTQDLLFDSQASDSKDETPSSPLEYVLAPSLTAMNLKLDSAPPDDFSSDEEDSNKENVDPLLGGSAGLTSSPKGDPVKAFVDEEAEEEDDSDNDLARFKDNEDDEDNMDSEELNDVIATGYEEKPIDNEMRNQLHQKWLEQQDDVGTENLLQRLNFGSKQKEMTMLEERDDEESEEEFLNDPAEYFVPRNALRMNLKKAKEMIPLMFTDKDDVYVSSDDEETEKSLIKRRRLSDKAEEQSTFLSPAKDESSKEIFGLIKKLNGVPDARRKAKITSYFHMLSLGGSSTMSSKSSFLSRGSRNSLPSFQKHGPSTVRSFVFERDDSNSRSAISMPEDSSDTVQKEIRPKKTVKFSSSQVTYRSQSTQTTAENHSGPSLHEILRCPSIQSSNWSGGSVAGQVEAIYAAFKLDQNLMKKEPGVSIRTA